MKQICTICLLLVIGTRSAMAQDARIFKNDFGGGTRLWSFCFSMNNKAYIGTGSDDVNIQTAAIIFQKFVAGTDKAGIINVQIPGIKNGMYVMQAIDKTHVRTTRFVVQR